MSSGEKARYIFEDFELDLDRLELRRAGALIPMEPQAFEVLAYLVANHERAVLKDEIVNHVWPSGFITDGALNTRILDARKAIGDSGRDQRLIRTIRGRGYRFVGAVEAPEPASSVTPPAAVHPPQPGVAPAPPPGDPGLDIAATTFIGRADELGRLEELLRSPGCRLITIFGPGGVGKTRLAAELSGRLRASGHDVAAVSLHAASSGHELNVAIANALGLSPSRLDPVTIADHIGDRDAVLVLDNFEHLVASGATTLATLVTRTPALRIIVTSREVPGLREEWLFPIGGLLNEQTEGEIGATDAARLFLDREARAGALTPGDGLADASVERICRLVDGMPLALELAAALRRYLTRDEIAEQVERDIDVLRSELKNLPARHRTVRGLFDESCRRLSDEQLRALLGLAVFNGSFSADAAARIAGVHLPIMATLVDHSLVQPRQGRFALHPLLRQYARDLLGDRLAALQGAHAEYFMTFPATVLSGLEGAHQAEAAARIDAELHEGLAAWHWACGNGRFALIEAAAYPLYLHAHLRSAWQTLRPAVERAVDAAELAGAEGWPALSLLLPLQTWALIRTSPGPEVVAANNRAEALYRAHGQLPPPGFATDPEAVSALILWSGGRYEPMRRAAESAEARARLRGDAAGEVYALWLGAVARHRTAELQCEAEAAGEAFCWPASPACAASLEEAAALLERALAILAARDESWFRSSVLMELAFNAKARGDIATGVTHAEEAYAIRSGLGDRRGVAEALIELAGSHCTLHDAAMAEARCREAEPIVRKLGDPGLTSELDRALALTAWVRKDLPEALECAARAAELSLRIGSVNNILGSLRIAGQVFEQAGELEPAVEIFALVLGHPASPPFARAASAAALERLGKRLPAEDLAQIRARGRDAHLPQLTESMLRRIRSHGTNTARYTTPVPGNGSRRP